MSALRDLQVRFDAALFAREPVTRAGIATEIVPGNLDPVACISIYRNNLRAGAGKALAIEFPVIERLVGTDYFRQLALAFLERHPSRSGDLYEIGEPFAAFLRSEYAATRYEYLADVAALEWAYQQATLAPVPAKFDSAALRAVPARNYAAIRFELTVGCRVVRSPYPILRIWLANQTDAAGNETIGLADGAEDVLVQRVDSGVRVQSLTPADSALLQAFSAKCDFEEAFDRTQRAAPDVDLAAQLRRYIDLSVITVAPSTVLALSGAHLP